MADPNPGPTTRPFQYTGQQRDGNGLIYLRARYDDPATGRFLSRDALAGAVLVPESLNRLIYARDNPVLVTDPSGRCGSWFSPIPDDYECLAIDPTLQYGEGQPAGGTGKNEIRLQQAEASTGDSGSTGAAGAKGPESSAISQTLKASYIHKGIKVYRV